MAVILSANNLYNTANINNRLFYNIFKSLKTSVLWRSWLGDREAIWPVKCTTTKPTHHDSMVAASSPSQEHCYCHKRDAPLKPDGKAAHATTTVILKKMVAACSLHSEKLSSFSALTLLVQQQERHPACKKHWQNQGWQVPAKRNRLLPVSANVIFFTSIFIRNLKKVKYVIKIVSILTCVLTLVLTWVLTCGTFTVFLFITRQQYFMFFLHITLIFGSFLLLLITGDWYDLQLQ